MMQQNSSNNAKNFMIMWLTAYSNLFFGTINEIFFGVKTVADGAVYSINLDGNTYSITSNVNSTEMGILQQLKDEVDSEGLYNTNLSENGLRIDNMQYYIDFTMSDNLIVVGQNGVVVLEDYNNALDALGNKKAKYPFVTFRESNSVIVARSVKRQKTTDNTEYSDGERKSFEIDVFCDENYHIDWLSYLIKSLKFEEVLDSANAMNMWFDNAKRNIIDVSAILGGRAEKRANTQVQFYTKSCVVNTENRISAVEIDSQFETDRQTEITNNITITG